MKYSQSKDYMIRIRNVKIGFSVVLEETNDIDKCLSWFRRGDYYEKK